MCILSPTIWEGYIVQNIEENTGLGRDEKCLVRVLCLGEGMHT